MIPVINTQGVITEVYGRKLLGKKLRKGTPQHLFYGRYQFDDDFTPINLERLRQQLSTEEVSRLYAAG